MQLLLQQAFNLVFGIRAPIINGDVAGGERQLLVDRFNEAPGFRIMILSPEAAGVGLNITGANHAIHYGRLWNPAKENQASDRIYRLGQPRPVTIHYPIVVGKDFESVEQVLDQLLSEKQQLADDVLWPRERLALDDELTNRLVQMYAR